jgi:hypothetical protein
MAVNRQVNAVGQMRGDVSLIRAIEEGVCGDFDVLGGGVLAGNAPRVVLGFDLVSTGVTRATQLILQTAGSILLHPTASETGTVFNVPADRADEVLAPTNVRVTGAFAPSSVNFIGVDLVRQPDDDTRDLVAVMDDDTELEDQKTLPTARTLDYKIVISTIDFSATPGLCPIAKVTTDAALNVTAIEDTRSKLFRLHEAYTWPAGRTNSTDFTPAGDKVIGDFPTWAAAVMTRLWDTNGGERWYSPTADRNVLVTASGAVFSNGQYFEWDGTHVHWKGLTILFDNSTGRYNDVAAQTSNSAGLTDLADGECIYVDLDRTANRTGGTALVGVKASLSSLGAPTTPGARFILVWRHGSNLFSRDQTAPVGQSNASPATTSTIGTVRVTATPPVAGAPVAVLADASTRAVATGITRAGSGGPGSGALAVGTQTADTSVAIGHSASTGTAVTGAVSALLAILGMQGLQLPLTTQTGAPSTDKANIELHVVGSTPNARYQILVRWPSGDPTVLAESEEF